MESLKVITRQASLRIAEYAFHYAKENNRKRVSAIHKANIMKKTDGLFLEVCGLDYAFLFVMKLCTFLLDRDCCYTLL